LLDTRIGNLSWRESQARLLSEPEWLGLGPQRTPDRIKRRIGREAAHYGKKTLAPRLRL
jgi:hypothetical protein